MVKCACGCDGEESLGFCATPKVAIGGNVNAGSVTICEDSARGIFTGLFPIEIRSASCFLAGWIERINATNAWRYLVRTDLPGGGIGTASVLVVVSTPSCEGYTVSWKFVSSVSISITVNGQSNTNSVNDPNASDGTVYALSSTGSAWTLGGGGNMLFDDDTDMEFIDNEQMKQQLQ